MVREYVRSFRLYDAEYHENQSDLLAQFQTLRKQAEEYLREVKDVILDDVRDVMQDQRRSINGNLTVQACKTPGMKRQRTKRKKPVIELDSPNSSFVSVTSATTAVTTPGSIQSLRSVAAASECSTMTPNRTASTFKGKRLKSLLEQNSIRTTPVKGPAGRLTRAQSRQLEESIANSTSCSILSSTRSTRNTRQQRVKIVEESEDLTPVNTPVLPSFATSTTPLHATPNETTKIAVPSPAVITAAGELPEGTPPVANSTMVAPSTPAAPFGGNITAIEATPVTETKRRDQLVVSSPIGPITTTATPGNSTGTNKWRVSTGRKKSKEQQEAPVVGKRLQLTVAPSPAPVATPQAKILLSKTLTRETPSPVDDGGSLIRTPTLAELQTPSRHVRTALPMKVPVIESTLSEAEEEERRRGEALGGIREEEEGEADDSEIDFSRPAEGMEMEDAPAVEASAPGEEKASDSNPEMKDNVEGEMDDVMEAEGEHVAQDVSMRTESDGPPEEQEREEGRESYVDMSLDDAVGAAVKETAPSTDKEDVVETEADKENVAPEELVEEHTEKEEDAEKPEAPPVEDNFERTYNFEEIRTPEVKQKLFFTDVLPEVVEKMPENGVAAGKETASSEEGPERTQDAAPEPISAKLEPIEKGIGVDEGTEIDPEDSQVDLFESADEDYLEEEVDDEKKEEKEEVKEDIEEEKEVKEDIMEDKEEQDELKDSDVEATNEKPAIEPELPARKTRSKSQKKKEDPPTLMKEEPLRPLRKTRSSKKKTSEEDEVFATPEKEKKKSLPKQGTVKKLVAKYDSPTKDPAPPAPPPKSRIPVPSKPAVVDKKASHDSSKRGRDIENDSSSEQGSASADESIYQKKRMKNNEGQSMAPPNLLTSVFSLVKQPTVVVKSAKELEEEKREAARKKIEEKEVKSQQVLNKKKQRENELRLKRIEKEKRMRRAKMNKEEEEKKKKGELEEKMKKKEALAAREREILAKKEEEKKMKELKKQELVEKRRREAEKARELKRKKLQEEAEERKQDALKRKQELEAQKVRELEERRQEEEARLEEQRKQEQEERERKQLAEEVRRKREEEERRKRAEEERTRTPPRASPTRLAKTGFTGGAGTLHTDSATPPRPPRPAKAKVPVEEKAAHCRTVQDKDSIASTTTSADGGGGLKSSNMFTPLAEKRDVDSPTSATSSRLQSYMKSKMLSLGTAKSKLNLTGARLGAITEDGKAATAAAPRSYDPRDNYRIDDLESGDETDEETKPKRTVPSWARNKIALSIALDKQFLGSRSCGDIFGPYPQTVDLDSLFGTSNKFKSRTSSAHWSAAPSAGAALDFSILTEDEVNRANRLVLKEKRT